MLAPPNEIENIKLALMSGIQVICYTGMIVPIALWLLKRVFYGKRGRL